MPYYKSVWETIGSLKEVDHFGLRAYWIDDDVTVFAMFEIPGSVDKDTNHTRK